MFSDHFHRATLTRNTAYLNQFRSETGRTEIVKPNAARSHKISTTISIISFLGTLNEKGSFTYSQADEK
jgi:hypothetical protein